MIVERFADGARRREGDGENVFLDLRDCDELESERVTVYRREEARGNRESYENNCGRSVHQKFDESDAS